MFLRNPFFKPSIIGSEEWMSICDKALCIKETKQVGIITDTPENEHGTLK